MRLAGASVRFSPALVRMFWPYSGSRSSSGCSMPSAMNSFASVRLVENMSGRSREAIRALSLAVKSPVEHWMGFTRTPIRFSIS